MSYAKAVLLEGFGGYDKIRSTSIELPQPSENEVIVQIRACGMNFSDTYNRQGIFTFHDIKPPFVMGVEGAGNISKVGSNVTNFEVGDRVMCWNFSYGIWSSYVKLPASHCYPIPINMSFEQAACIPVNYVTAYQVIVEFGGLKPGQSILIQSAGGGVGWAATQIARSIKNVTIFGTASKAKHEAIKENGVQHAIDYRSHDFVDEVLKISPTGVNVVLDCLSGNDFIRSQKLLKNMGRLVHIGISNAVTGERWNPLQLFKVWWQTKNVSIYDLIQANHSVCGLNIANLQQTDPEAFINAIEQVLKLYGDGILKPRIDSVWTFDQVVEASKRMMRRENIGKIILTPYDDN